MRDKTPASRTSPAPPAPGPMYGAGYAGAQDRLWLMDLMRHVGRGELTSFAGGAGGQPASSSRASGATPPYTEADLQAQIDRPQELPVRAARRLYTDMQNYLAGINQYIADVHGRPELPRRVRPDRPRSTRSPTPAIQPVHAHRPDRDRRRDRRAVRRRRRRPRCSPRWSAGRRRAKYGTTRATRSGSCSASRTTRRPSLTLHNGQTFPYGRPTRNAAGVAMPDAGHRSTPQQLVVRRRPAPPRPPARPAPAGLAELAGLG